MTWFKIISLEEFESYDGIVKVGEEINTIEMNDYKEAKEWAEENYGPYGQDIKHKVVRCKRK